MVFKKGFPAATRSSVRKDLGLLLKKARANGAKKDRKETVICLMKVLNCFKIKSYCFGTVLTPVFVGYGTPLLNKELGKVHGNYPVLN